MTKKSVRGEFNSFVKGLISEASPLNFPEQAARDINNFELNKDGSLNRRLGFGFEDSYSLRDTLLSKENIIAGMLSSYVWEDPAGQAGEKYLVVQQGDFLKFFDLSTDSLTGDGYLGEIAFPSTNLVLNTGSYASVDGKLVIATGDSTVYLVEYNTGTLAFSISSFILNVRDIWGISNTDSDANPSNRPTSSVASHRYNLYNQGWNAPRRINTTTFADPSQTVFTTLGYYPADTDQVWSALITIPDGSTPKETFSTDAYRETLNASSSTAKGGFIINLLDRGASREAAITANALTFPLSNFTSLSTVDDKTLQGAAVVSEYAGRIFYSGFGPTTDGDARSPDLSSYIAFSRLIRNTNDFGKCYQEGDPSSRDSNDIVDTDGGLIRVSGATDIKRLVVAGKNLLVFASNGVWSIEGGSDFGFTATNYKVDRLSTFGSVGPDSIVVEGDKVYYWAEDSIYTLQKNQLGDLGYQSLTEATIEKYYEKISFASKKIAKGAYDRITKKVRWLYPEGDMFTEEGVTKELVLDTLLGAYSVNTINNLINTTVFNLFVGSLFVNEISGEPVLVGADVVFADADEVTVDATVLGTSLQSVKYLALYFTGGTVKMTIGWFNQSDFVDWKDIDSVGEDAKAWLLTGELTAGDSSIHKQTPVLITHFRRTENTINSEFELDNPSGCLIRTAWDWASSTNSGKMSPLFQAYRFRRHYMPATAPGEYDTGFSLVTTRNKVRGRGRAFSLYMETEPGKDCNIVGWSLSLNGNTVA